MSAKHRIMTTRPFSRDFFLLLNTRVRQSKETKASSREAGMFRCNQKREHGQAVHPSRPIPRPQDPRSSGTFALPVPIRIALPIRRCLPIIQQRQCGISTYGRLGRCDSAWIVVVVVPAVASADQAQLQCSHGESSC